MNFNGKVAIVTGASSGIGVASARLLAGKGAKVALVSRSKEKLEMLSRDIPGSIVIPADITREDDIKMMVKETERRFGKSTS